MYQNAVQSGYSGLGVRVYRAKPRRRAETLYSDSGRSVSKSIVYEIVDEKQSEELCTTSN